MVYGMSLNQLKSTMVARDFSLNMEVTLMFHMMSLHPLMQTMVTRELSLNGEVNTFTEPRRGDRRRKEATQPCNTAHVHSAARQTSNML